MNCLLINCIFTFCTSHITIHVIIYTKPKLVKLKGSDYELKGQTKIHRGKNTNGIKLGNYPCGTTMSGGFLQC